MPIERPVLSNLGMCKLEAIDSDRVALPETDVRSLRIREGDEVSVILVSLHAGRPFDVGKREAYSAEVKSTEDGELYVDIPERRARELRLRTGEMVQAFVWRQDAFPGEEEGPLRQVFGKARKVARGTESVGSVTRRPKNREDVEVDKDEGSATFDSSVATTGQTRVPSKVMTELNLEQGDTVDITAFKGDDSARMNNRAIRSNDRFTVPKSVRDELEIGDNESVSFRLEK